MLLFDDISERNKKNKLSFERNIRNSQLQNKKFETALDITQLTIFVSNDQSNVLVHFRRLCVMIEGRK